MIHVKDFGSTGRREDDATAGFIKAAASLPSSGGTIYVDPDGVYKITRKVSYSKPILWLCDRGASDVSTNTNGGDAEKPLVYWGSGTPVDYILEQKPARVGTAIFGGGVEGINFDGLEIAEHAVHFDNCRYTTLLGKARNFTKNGALISSLSGTQGVFSMKCHVKDWDYIYGTSDLTMNSNGLRIMGNGKDVAATQHKIDRVFALIKHGAALQVEETDNCQIYSAQAVGVPGGKGCTILYRNVGSTVAYNNHVTYCAGEIRQEDGCFGNIVEHLTSEGGGIGQVSGEGTWHGAITNYDRGSERYRSHEYKLRKVLSVGAGEMHGLAQGLFAYKWSAGVMPNVTNSTATAIIPIDAELGDGVIESVSVLLGANVGDDGDYLLTMELSTAPLNDFAPAVTPERVVAERISSPPLYAIKEHTFTAGWSELPTRKGDVILVNINRLPQQDTARETMFLLGIRIRFRAYGPRGTTALYLPKWGMP